MADDPAWLKAQFDENGDLISEAVVDDRWHVNVRTRSQAAADALAGVAIEAPTTPVRVFA